MPEETTTRDFLIVTYNEYPAFDGLSVRVHNLAVQMSKRGVRVTIIAPRYSPERLPHPWEENPPYRLVTLETRVPKALAGVKILGRALKNWTLIRRTSTVVRKLRKDMCPAVVQAEEFNASLPALIAKKRLRASTVLVDDVTLMKQAIAGHRVPGIATLVHLIERIVYKRIDAFVCASRQGVDYLKEIRPNADIYLLPNGVDTEICRPAGEMEIVKGQIFFNCSLSCFQNVEAVKNALSVFGAVKQKVPHASLLLICPPLSRMSAELRHQVQSTEGVTVMDGVPDLVPYISKAAVNLMPYTPGQGTLGGAKLKLLEYMACGCIVVATPGSLDGVEGLQTQRDLLTVQTLDEMADTVVRILQAPEQFKDLRLHARAFVRERYDWQIIVNDDYLNFLFDRS